jgi:SAM-dependent methyltransferase
MAEELKRQAMALADTFKNMPPGAEMGNFYDSMDPEVYNELLNIINFTEKDVIARQVYGSLALPKDAWIFDAGCGTGVIAEMLHAQGYSNIDGADASERFLALAQSKGWYKDCEAFFFGNGVEAFPAKFKGKYDCCCASGVFLPNHMPPSAMDDIHCSLKTGGYFVTAMRSYLYVDGEGHGYKDKIEELIAEGKFKLHSKGDFTRGFKEEK